jgi:hypothetical protein
MKIGAGALHGHAVSQARDYTEPMQIAARLHFIVEAERSPHG